MEKNKLRTDYEKACNAYVEKLKETWEVDGWWVGEDVGTVWCFLDNDFLRMDEIILCVDESIGIDEYREWNDYNTFAAEFNQNAVNLKSWHMGYHGIPKEEQESLRKLKSELEEAVKDCKEKF